LEFPGAIYHVINRGNRRVGPFDEGGAAEAFERCLGQACDHYGWVVHAFVVMSNHYHIALETPLGNLSSGMQWMQTTFSNRYNRYRGESGHVFQGRYKALLVEQGEYLAGLINYIDLNPVRAGLRPLEKLETYPYGSYRYLFKPMARPRWLRLESCLSLSGGLSDDTAGWENYRAMLSDQLRKGPAGTSASYVKMSQGWVLGSEIFKAKLVSDHKISKEARAWEKSGAKEVARLQWQRELERLLGKLGKTQEDIRLDKKSAPWKIAIAIMLKGSSSTSNAWVAEILNMGTPTLVSQVMSLARKKPERYMGILAQLTKD
jgi:REP element-mobilizing transposase RayT